ncbi:MAG: S-methyl-5-thioribose kinase [Candidatus Poribacteria bacterium]|nr:S-methyl-5-thioribose kinase [Candidatus Poribacteria bacterium]
MELSRETIPQYLRQRQVEIGFFDPDTDLHFEEIGDGNLNFVYRVFNTEQPERSLVLKQAPPYIKILGPDYPLSPDRLTFESLSLGIYNQFESEAVPTQYYFDSNAAVIVMEDLRGYRLLRDNLIAGQVNQKIPELIGQFMGSVHSQTYAKNLDSAAADKYREDFANTVMQSITADYVFTLPFIEHETNFWTKGLESEVLRLKTDDTFLQQAQNLKTIFLTAQQGLTHGDLHTGSIMVKSNSAKVIDSEFAFYGPVGFDIGLYWANYFLSYFSHTDNSDVQSELKTAIVQTWDAYTTEFQMADEVQKVRTLQQIFYESVGFAGMEMLRRIIGAAHVKDIERIEDVQRKLRIETAILEFGSTLVKQHQNISTIDELIELL